MNNRVSGKQKTVYFISGNSQVYNGMPQGSSLGLLIFIYSLNDFIALKIIMIADDAVFFLFFLNGLLSSSHNIT